MRNIRAIQTRYAGRFFRSRLEARWAVFFDSLGIKWMYEPEGFELANGEAYLPDFFLPRFSENFRCREKAEGLYVEVKPPGGDFGKACRFAEQACESILLAEGEPTAGELDVVYGVDHLLAGTSVSFVGKYLPCGSHSAEYRLYEFPCGIPPCPVVSRAVSAALSARFDSMRTLR